MLKIVEKNKIQSEIDSVLKEQAFNLDSPQEQAVKEIVRDVAKRGDKALVEYTKKFDSESISIKDLAVSPAEIESAYGKVERAFRDTLSKAVQNITAYHQKQRPDEWFETLPLDVILGQRVIPLQKAGIYVPGGRAAYPSQC